MRHRTTVTPSSKAVSSHGKFELAQFKVFAKMTAKPDVLETSDTIAEQTCHPKAPAVAPNISVLLCVLTKSIGRAALRRSTNYDANEMRGSRRNGTRVVL